MTTPAAAQLVVSDLDLVYGTRMVQRDLSFEVARGEVFVIMGGSGCGKSTLLAHLLGLRAAARGSICYDGWDLTRSTEAEREVRARRFGVLFQGGALWSALTLAENVALPLERHTQLSPAEIRELVSLRLAWVGLEGYGELYPAQLSGGMIKRGGLARALALDPEILFFDEPSAGLDPTTSRRLDELILQLRDGLGTTVVVVTHELRSIFAIADRALFLSAQRRTMTGLGTLAELQASEEEEIREFLGPAGVAGQGIGSV